ncbi:MAG: MFS transporter [Desulfotomaculaceae bacterium]|nr:MFS transporter [Desulfotomaculaceae bacterium]
MEKPKLWTKDFVIITFLNLIAFLNFYLLIVIISGYAMSRFDSSPGEAGFAVSIFVIGTIIIRLFAGKWIVRIGHKKTLYAGIVLCLLMSLLYLVVNNIYLMYAVRFVHGVAFGIATTATGTIVASIIPKARSGEGIAYFGLSVTLAIALGPFLGMSLSQLGGYNMVFIANISAMAVGIVLLQLLSFSAIEFNKGQLQEVSGFKFSNFIEPRVMSISTVLMIIFICYGSVVSSLAEYAQEVNLVDAASFFFVIYSVVILISRPFVGRLFDSVGENLIMYSSIIIYIIGMSLFSNTHHGFTLLLSGALLGISIGAIQSSTQAISVKITPMHRMGLANSTYFLALDLGMGFGPILTGLIIPFTDYRSMYTGAAIVGAACLLLYYLVHGRTVYSSAGYSKTQ